MELIDSHCHLTFRELAGNLQSVMERARAAGVTRMITVATDVDDGDRAIALASEYDGVWCSAGIHPHEASKVQDDHWDTLAAQLADKHVVAAGEIGLDFHYDFSDKQSQYRVFKRQLELVRPTDLPLIIHCRDAYDETIEVLEEHGFRERPVVFHCFNGNDWHAHQIRQRGWRVSLTGIVTFKKSVALRQLIRKMPPDELMLETDAPYLAPEPVRHVRPNEPAHLVHTAQFLAELIGIDVEELARQTTAATREFFNLS